MRRALVHLTRRHAWATAALALALVALVYFGWKLVDDTRRAVRASEPDLALWMTPRYVAKSWDLPRQEIFRIMEIPPGTERDAVPRTLAKVLERNGLTLAELQRRVELADARRRAARDGGDRDERAR